MVACLNCGGELNGSDKHYLYPHCIENLKARAEIAEEALRELYESTALYMMAHDPDLSDDERGKKLSQCSMMLARAMTRAGEILKEE